MYYYINLIKVDELTIINTFYTNFRIITGIYFIFILRKKII